MEKIEVTGFLTAFIIATLFTLIGAFILGILFLVKKRESERLSKLNGALLESQIEVREQTLRIVSQEIHDNIGQVLSVAKRSLGRINPNDTEDMLEKVADSKNHISRAIQDLRDLAKSMNTDKIMQTGIVKAVDNELQIIKKSGFEIVMEVEGEIVRQDPKKELILFRIIQESLNNIIKHSDGTRIWAQFNYSSENVLIILRDNGKGFDQPTINSGDKELGLGVQNMKDRASLIGAKFFIKSIPKRGTETTILLPLNK